MPELLLRPDLGKKAYRLRCRFTVEAYTLPDRIDKYKFKMAEKWVADMYKQGWDYDPNVLPLDDRGFKLRGPFSATPITGLPKLKDIRPMTNREALARVMAGDKLRDTGEDWAVTLPEIDKTDKWEYELSAVFVRNTILTEVPDSHEEIEVNKTQ